MRKCYALVAALIAVFLLVVPFAFASGPASEQAGMYVSTDGINKFLSRGVKASVSVSSSIVGADDFVYAPVRLSTGSDPTGGLVQVGWFKMGASVPQLDQGCVGGDGQAHAGIVIEKQPYGGSYNCVSFIPTPVGLTWGQSLLFQVKYVGNNRGNHSLMDYDVQYNNVIVPVNDVSGISYQDASVVNEWYSVDGSTPPQIGVSFSNLSYQDASKSASTPFVVSTNRVFIQPLGGNFKPVFVSGGGTNSGSIDYPNPSGITTQAAFEAAVRAEPNLTRFYTLQDAAQPFADSGPTGGFGAWVVPADATVDFQQPGPFAGSYSVRFGPGEYGYFNPFDPMGNECITIEWWMKVNSTPSNFSTIVDGYNYAVVLLSDGRLQGLAQYNGFGFVTDQAVNDGLWHHYSLQRTTDFNSTLYKDGVVMTPSPILANMPIATPATDLFFGVHEGTADVNEANVAYYRGCPNPGLHQ